MMVSLNWVAPQQLSTVLAFSLRGTAKNLVLKVYQPPLTLGKEDKVAGWILRDPFKASRTVESLEPDVP